MAGGRFSKQGDYKSFRYLNTAGAGDPPVIGNWITTAPTGLQASQGQQTVPGDRIIVSPMDVVAFSDPAVGNIGTGTYRYVATVAGSTSNPARGHGAFWVNAPQTNAQDMLYQVTSDEVPTILVSLFAGVFLNPVAKGNFWWIQESGKCTLAFRTTLTGTAAIGGGVYLAGAGNNSVAGDVGAFDQVAGAGSSTAATVDAALNKYVGVAESLPAALGTALVDVTLARASFRW